MQKVLSAGRQRSYPGIRNPWSRSRDRQFRLRRMIRRVKRRLGIQSPQSGLGTGLQSPNLWSPGSSFYRGRVGSEGSFRSEQSGSSSLQYRELPVHLDFVTRQPPIDFSESVVPGRWTPAGSQFPSGPMPPAIKRWLSLGSSSTGSSPSTSTGSPGDSPSRSQDSLRRRALINSWVHRERGNGLSDSRRKSSPSPVAKTPRLRAMQREGGSQSTPSTGDNIFDRLVATHLRREELRSSGRQSQSSTHLYRSSDSHRPSPSAEQFVEALRESSTNKLDHRSQVFGDAGTRLVRASSADTSNDSLYMSQEDR